MNENLDLNDFKIDLFDFTELQVGLSDFAEGHGITEIGASSASCYGIGSCTTPFEQ